MIFAQLTDVGRKRAHNEDNLGASSFTIEYGDLCDEFAFGVVCDGMGGAAGGEIASAIAVEALLRGCYQRLLSQYMDKGTVFLRVHQILEDVTQSANMAVYQEAHSRPGFSGMGCTSTAMLACHGRAFFAQVGDSRAYLYRGGALRQVTMDHSFVSELMREGRITAEEAEAHPRKSVITRAIGSRPEVEPDIFEEVLEAGDIYLVCSDGLSGMLSDDDMAEMIAGVPAHPDKADLDALCRRLIDGANENGGTDNISVVLGVAEAADVRPVFDPIPLTPAPEGVLTWTDAVHLGLPDQSFRDLRLGRRRR